MQRDIAHLCISRQKKVRDAIAQINESATGIVFVVDEDDRFLGTVTDGDIRRGILADISLDSPATDVMCDEPVTVTPGTSEGKLLECFKQTNLEHLPVVQKDQTLVGVHILSDWIKKLEPEESSEFSAVVMAGGLGTRLRPHTEDTPKPLIEVNGKPILERILEHLASAGAKDVFVTTRYLGEQIKSYFSKENGLSCRLHYLEEQSPLGTCGSLHKLSGEIDEAFLLMNGDLLTDFDVEKMFEFHQDQGVMLTMGVRHYSMEVPYGVAEVDNGRVEALSEKPIYDFFVNAGIYIIEPEALDFIPVGDRFDVTELIDELIEDDSEVASYPILQRWMDIGRPEDLKEAKRLLEKKNRD